ncbi:hypothetical protein H5T55_02800 [Candidatus Bipolaricaulota bacterium]|nr:hypothetical protein [Candidatus Bipolaricaulota bacterium]
MFAVKRRRWWLAVLALGGGALAVALVISLLRPPVGGGPDDAEVPAEWFADPPGSATAHDGTPGEAPASEEGHVPEPSDIVPKGYVQVGRLAYELDGRRVAEETYRLERLGSDAVRLTSSGRFFFRVVVVAVSVAFEQEIQLDGDLRPRTYTLETRGPLGFGNQRITVAVEGTRAVATSGDERQEIPMPDGDAIFVGTLAAYALLPAVHLARAPGKVLLLQPVGSGAGPGGRAAAGGPIEVIHDGTTELAVGGRAVIVERYRVQAGGFTGTLLARGLEFVAFLGEGERVFLAYRVDLFPRGLGRGP